MINGISGEIAPKSSTVAVNDQANEVSLGIKYCYLIYNPDMNLNTGLLIDVVNLVVCL